MHHNNVARMLSIERQLIVFCLLEIVNLLSVSFEVQSELLHWPYNVFYIGKSSEFAESPWTVSKKSEKTRKMFTVPAAMFEIGGKPRFHALDPGSVGPVLFCHYFVYFFICLFSLLLFLLFLSFFFFIVCLFVCLFVFSVAFIWPSLSRHTMQP